VGTAQVRNNTQEEIEGTFCLILSTQRPLVYCCRNGFPRHNDDSTWLQLRTLVIAPIAEEVIFRGVIFRLLLAHYTTQTAIYIALPVFSLAHLHHFVHECFDYGVGNAIQESLFRVCYTTIFGFLSSMLYLATFTIWSPILAHVWCNYFGVLFLPQSTAKFDLACYAGGLVTFIWFMSQSDAIIAAM